MRYLQLCLGILFGIGAIHCASAPSIERHSPLKLSVGPNVFVDGGCELISVGGRSLQCGPETTLGRLGCTVIALNLELAGLEPAESVARCLIDSPGGPPVE